MTKTWIRFIIILFSFLVWVPTIDVHIYAQEYPEREGNPIIDPAEQFAQPEKTNLREYITSLPHEYVLVFLEKIEEDGHAYAQDLFEHYELGSNAILFVISTEEPSSLFFAYGNQLIEEGLTDQGIQEREETFFQSYAREQNFLTGMGQLIKSLELDLENLAQKREREKALTIQDPTTEEETVEQNEKPLPWWIILLSVLFVSIVMFILWSFFYRRKITKLVDELETWKIQIENQPFSSQLARIKGLKLAGETEIQFEKWKDEWEEILTTTLPSIEESLIDIEEEADRYRFFRCLKMIDRTKKKLREIEEALEAIVLEIDELTSNEKNNRDLAAKLHEQYQEIKVSLHKNSLALGISYAIWFEKFKATSEWFEGYNQAQEGGDYLRAKDLLEAIENVFAQINEAIELTPDLVKQIELDVPTQLKEMEQAIEEMREKEYQIEHLGVEEKLAQLTANKHELVAYMEKGQIKKMKSWLAHFADEIEAIYTSLEEEVKSKAYVLQTLPLISKQKGKLKEAYEHLVYESDKAKQSYAWDEEWEEKLVQLKKQFQELESLAEHISVTEDEVVEKYPILKPELIGFEEKADHLSVTLKSFKENLNQLREEELQALEALKEMKQIMININIELRKSNLPGVPEHLLSGLSIADEALVELEEKLAEVPLHMHKLLFQLQEAKAQVHSVSQVAESVMSQAQRAEQLIPYANRYRRNNQLINELLIAAEDAFRKLQFREAVELVEEVLDMSESNWRDKIEQDENEEIKLV